MIRRRFLALAASALLAMHVDPFVWTGEYEGEDTVRLEFAPVAEAHPYEFRLRLVRHDGVVGTWSTIRGEETEHGYVVREVAR